MGYLKVETILKEKMTIIDDRLSYKRRRHRLKFRGGRPETQNESLLWLVHIPFQPLSLYGLARLSTSWKCDGEAPHVSRATLENSFRKLAHR